MSSDYIETYMKRVNASRPAHERMVDADIKRCEEYLAGDRNEQDGLDLHLDLITKYPSYIADFGKSLYNYNNEHGFMGEYFGTTAMIANLTVMKSKLEGFRSFGYQNGNLSAKGNRINIENKLTANQSQTVTVTFEEVKRKVEEMNALSEVETQDTLAKIDEIRAIVELKDSPKTKWQKVKPILAWVADKSVDVGIALLPLILKIGG